MDRVLDRLWIGSSSDLEPRVPLRSLGFVAVVDLRDVTTATARQDDLAVQRVQNRDGDPWKASDVEDIFQFIDKWLRTGRVLVACAAGMSRSVSVVTGYLVKSGWGLPEAFERVRIARSQAAPVPAMLDSVLRAVEPMRSKCS